MYSVKFCMINFSHRWCIWEHLVLRSALFVNFGLEEFVVWSCAAVLLLIILIEWFISPIARNVESFFHGWICLRIQRLLYLYYGMLDMTWTLYWNMRIHFVNMVLNPKIIGLRSNALCLQFHGWYRHFKTQTSSPFLKQGLGAKFADS